MPKPTILLDYQRCDPDSCEGGICAAVKGRSFDRKLLERCQMYTPLSAWPVLPVLQNVPMMPYGK